jgi:hypothetical protein
LEPNAIDLVDLLYAALGVIGIGLLLSLILLIYIFSRVRRIKLPDDAGILTALRETPLSVVVLLDMLDLSLDFLSAPLSWTILGRLGLKPLQGITVIESLIPGTQLIPTLTLGWILARLLGDRDTRE